MSRWFTYLLISLFLFSCTKKETLRVSVKNMVTGESVANMNINVYEVFNVSDGVSGTKTELFQSGETNSEGVLFLTEKFNKNRRYEVFVGQFPEEHCYLNRMGYTWSVGEATDLAFEYAPCAYLKMRIENVNCTGDTDNFKLYYLGRQVGGQSPPIVGAQMRDEDGCYFFESSSYSDAPMGERYYRREVTRNGITEIFYDTIYLNA
ncbi:hypothetical protein, partial [Wandonia haliotis]|uniref:hypothetical protein n=1 Tax=Wandonia haliotis TaxID=574963 RepID=UPI0031CEE6A9